MSNEDPQATNATAAKDSQQRSNNVSTQQHASQPQPALRDAEKVDVFEYEPAGFMSNGRW